MAMLSEQTNTLEPQLARDLPPLSEAALYLDFDGTLVDLADTPDGIAVPEDLPALLAALHRATGGATVLVSGRRLSDIEAFLPDFPGDVVGSHGAEFREHGTCRAHPAAGTPELDALKARVRDWATPREGVLVEDKPASIVLHYRQAPALAGQAEAAMEAIVRDYPGFVLHRAKMAYELHPDDVSKADAVGRLHGERWPTRRPFAIGDDRTDEGMMAVALDHGGIAVKVGEGESRAPHRIASPRAVRQMLQEWLGAKEGQDQ
jgi:trehalose 6-phosphate phosphatase